MTTNPLSLDNQICFSLYRTQRLATRLYQDLLKDLNLTYPQYLAMLVLWEEEAPVSMSDLGARLELDSGTLTPLIKRLISLGYVTKQRDEQDERRAVLTLTDTGAQLRAQAESIPQQVYSFCSADGVNLSSLKGDLDALAEHLSN
ncbi:MAG: MarR family transcriptional regulator [Rothia sp. (in: high G+C Gram-positive bacteria)]|nr:MarR family transcriptional regulator [Rothia sp. (in: high G+C Gram-positive bacteria)]